MNILYTTARELSYPRNRLLHRLLGNNHNITYIGPRIRQGGILIHSIINSFKLLPYLRSEKKISLYVIGFYGHLMMLLIGKCIHKPILFDVFLSTYDTLSFDRRQFTADSVCGRIAKWVDQVACANATRVILDTEAHARFFNEVLMVPREKIDVLFVGCDGEIFHPLDHCTPKRNLVLFYGSLLNLHGIETILQAASLLKKHQVQFRIIAPLYKLKSYTKKLVLQNIEFIAPVPLEALPLHIAEATICLGGHFGATEKAKRVIAGKTFQCIAMGKPTIVGENPANHELLTHGYDAWFCKMNDPQALADSVFFLLNNPDLMKLIGQNAIQTFRKKASSQVLSSKLREIILHTIYPA